ncbi:hypothetical protein ABT061_16310 [Streptosporangium sp. NPDC002544]|uniref:hypothetical protein n=1 Tax=Streptosporangium sp. NPDC002544 TaxID=3154538 RepID=UPI0033331703
MVKKAPRTEINDISPVGTELDESALFGISGGQIPDRFVTHEDPPGICSSDATV